MRVTLLGTGSALPSANRLQAGIHLERNDHHLLVDCGSGVTHRLTQTNIDHRDVDTVLLTHHHLDHVADLTTLAKARWLEGHPAFTVVGPPGTREICERLFGIDDLDTRIDLEITELDADPAPFELGPYRVSTAQTKHSKPGFAYRFDDALTISGDTAPTRAVAALADGSNVLVHECAYPDGTDTETHSTPSALGRTLADVDVDVGRVLLTHLFPETEARTEDLSETVSQYTDAAVDVASDGDVVTIE